MPVGCAQSLLNRTDAFEQFKKFDTGRLLPPPRPDYAELLWVGSSGRAVSSSVARDLKRMGRGGTVGVGLADMSNTVDRNELRLGLKSIGLSLGEAALTALLLMLDKVLVGA
eukprot:SAG25_NODE_44_length_19254_cov_246.998121_5_plen_112_part_00